MKKMKKMLSLLLVLSMVLSMSFASAFADDGNGHTHNEGGWTCVQAEPVTQNKCIHVHDESCGYVPAVEGVSCACTDTDEDGVIDHVDGCGYVPAVEGHECNHVCSDECYTTIPGEWHCVNAVQAFLDAVEALKALAEEDAPDSDAVLEAQRQVINLYDALTEDQKTLLDADGAYADMVAGLKEAVTLEETEPETEGSIVDGNGTALVPEDGVYTVNATCTLTVKGTVKGRIVVNGGDVTIQGIENEPGTIDAGNRFDADGNKIQDGFEGSVLTINGGNVTLSGGVTITGGTGSILPDGDVSKEDETSGGGVLVENGSFTMNGGTITGNAASRGGGIYVAHEQQLLITGGEISYNTATGVERHYDRLPIDKNLPSKGAGFGSGNFGGGGIWINGKAEINPTSENIDITHNTSMTKTDLGGGGIYVNNAGSLKMTYVKITENEAEGLGGGLATCIHGKIAVVNTEGAAIYKNKAEGTASGLVSAWSGADVDGSQAWARTEEIRKEFAPNAKDVLSAGKKGAGDSGTVITNGRFDGQMHEWTGYVADDADGDFTKIDIGKNDDAIYGGYVLGLTAQNTKDLSEEFLSAEQNIVTISHNTSVTHGGGIGCNGTMILGAAETKVINLKRVSGDIVTAAKYLDNNLTGEQFTFELFKLLDDGSQKTISTASNDANGKVTLSYGSAIDYNKLNKEEGTQYEFYMREINKNRPEIEYDNSLYRFVVTISYDRNDSTTVGNQFMTVNRENYSAAVIECTKGHFTTDDSNGTQWVIDKKLGNDDTPTFYNTTITVGSLKIDKTVISDTPLQKGESFEFTVKLTDSNDQPVRGTFGGYDFETVPGEATVIISGFDVNTAQGSDGKWTDTQSVTIKDIPAGTQYTVAETANSSKDYNVTYGSNGATGSINAGVESKVEITNTTKPGSLTIDKTVVSDTPLRENEQFDFIVTLKDVNGNPVTGKFSGYEFNDAGEATVTISGFVETQDATDGRWKSDTKSVTIDGLPAGTTYTVTETDESRGRYTATYGNNGQTGVIQPGGSSEVNVLNTYTYTPYVPPVTPTPEDPTTPPTEIDDPDTPLGPGPDEPVVDIDDPDTPLAPATPDEPVTEIDEEEPPLAGAPKTGDDFQLWTWIALVMASGAGLAWLALTDRKRKNAVK